jgi:hypothetical protein
MQVGAPDTSTVVAALKSAAQATGSDFHYLLGTAMRESSLKANAQSATSTAAGLFQFVDQTWLGLVKSHGAKYGLGSLAGAISQDDGGRYHAANENDRQAILALKKDPQISALMAGEYAKSTQAAMQSQLGRPVCGGELYAAHFLGPDAACKLIRLNDSAPATSAASLFPQAAAANKTVFFDAKGAPKSVRDVYDWAMQQPGAAAVKQDVATQAAPSTSEPTPLVRAASAVDGNIKALLAQVMNWQPSGFFSSGGTSDAGAMPGSPLMLSHSMLDIFSSANDRDS